MRFILGELADNPMTGSDFDWMVSNHAVWGWKAPIKASVSGVSLLQLSPFFASIFPLPPETPDTQANLAARNDSSCCSSCSWCSYCSRSECENIVLARIRDDTNGHNF